MSAWQLDLAVGSLGLVLAALGVMVFLRRRGAEPVSTYRVLCWVLGATLAFPLGEVALRTSGLGARLPFAGRIAHGPWTAEAGEAGAVDPIATDASSRGAGGVRGDDAALYELEVPALGWLDGPSQDFAWEADPATRTTRAILVARVLTDLGDPGEDGEWVPAEADDCTEPGGAMPASTTPEALQPPASAATRALLARLLVGLYLAGLVLRLARTGLRLRRTLGLLERARPVDDPAVLSTWRRLRAHSPLTGEVRLLASAEIAAPMCFGLRRPVVLLPEAAGPALSHQVLSCVLLHELVHLERRDTWVMLGQELLGALFWFHPAAAWLSRHLDLYREQSCDLTVVRRTGRAKRYASALIEYATWMGRGVPETVPATSLVPWTTTNSQLARRIEMLVSENTPRRTMRGTLFLGATGLAALFGGQVALAASMSPAQGPLRQEKVEQEVEVTAVPAGEGESQEQEVTVTLSGDGERSWTTDGGETVVLRMSPDGEDQEIEVRGKVIVVDDDGGRQVIELDGDDGERVIQKRIHVGSGHGKSWVVAPELGDHEAIFVEGDSEGGEPQIRGKIVIKTDGGESQVFAFDGAEELERLAESGELHGLALGLDGNALHLGGGGHAMFFSDDDEGDDDTPMIGISIEGLEPGATELTIGGVEDGSLADRAGLRAGDVIVEVNDQPATWDNLNEAKKELTGEGVELDIERDGKELEVHLRAKGHGHGKARYRVQEDDDVFLPGIAFGKLEGSDGPTKARVRVRVDDDGQVFDKEFEVLVPEGGLDQAKLHEKLMKAMKKGKLGAGSDYEAMAKLKWAMEKAHGAEPGQKRYRVLRKDGNVFFDQDYELELPGGDEDFAKIHEKLKKAMKDKGAWIHEPGKREWLEKKRKALHGGDAHFEWRGKGENEFFFDEDEEHEGPHRFRFQFGDDDDDGGEHRMMFVPDEGDDVMFFGPGEGEHELRWRHEDDDEVHGLRERAERRERRARSDRSEAREDRKRQIDELRRALDERRRELDQLQRRLDRLMRGMDEERGRSQAAPAEPAPEPGPAPHGEPDEDVAFLPGPMPPVASGATGTPAAAGVGTVR